jgi:hypothetical protein
VLIGDPEEVRVDTLTSTDGGHGWTVSEGDALADVECCLGGLALR